MQLGFPEEEPFLFQRPRKYLQIKFYHVCDLPPEALGRGREGAGRVSLTQD